MFVLDEVVVVVVRITWPFFYFCFLRPCVNLSSSVGDLVNGFTQIPTVAAEQHDFLIAL